MSSSRILLLSTAAIAAMACAGTAAADTATPAAGSTDALGTVIVTARRVEENLQTVPATVTAVSGDQLRQQNIETVQDLATTTPSLSVASYFNDLNARFAVRGLTAGVVTYFAEAPCCGGVASAPFMDIASVQVLNGPQGTLFGRTSAAGAVLIEPVHPRMNEWGGLVDASVGNFNRAQFTGVVNIPLITDHLAARVAISSNHIDGYTLQDGTSNKLDGINNQQIRLSLEFKYGGFTNYVVGSYLNVDESGTGQVFAAYNPNLPTFTATTPSAGIIAACASAVNVGLATDTASCQSSRLTTVHNILSALAAQQARLNANPNAVRDTPASYDGLALQNMLHHGSVVDVAQYDFGDLGAMNLNVKNIFSYDSYTSDSSETSDGVGGAGEEGAFANAFYSNIGSNNENGSHLLAQMGPPLITYTEEIQAHANFGHGLFNATVGYFYQDQKAPLNDAGTTNVYKLFSGTSNANLGFNNAVGFIQSGDSNEKAVYVQGTLDLSKVGIHGLSLTAGYRDSWSATTQSSLNAVTNLPSGIFTPGTTLTTTSTSSSGYNYTFSVQEQWTGDVMTYATVSRAYVPGGVNALGQAATSLPNYTPTYAPATVLEEELGIKADLRFGGMLARLNVGIYNNDYSNIAETLTGLVGSTSVRYNENVAGASLRGVEVAGTLIPTPDWEIAFTYSYNDAKYTKWTGADPFNIATLANPGGGATCAPTSPAGVCWLNLTNNPFPYMPAQQGHITVTYHLPVDKALGDMTIAAIGYAQSREWFEATAARDLQLLPTGLNGISQGSYATLNLRLEWKDIKQSGWNGAAFVNNVTDTLYATGKVPQLETLGFAVSNMAPPRMFGIQVWKKFGE